MNPDCPRRPPTHQVQDHDAPVENDPKAVSDSDFESDGAHKRVVRQRNSAWNKSTSSALRDDRASMAKRSANKSPKQRTPRSLSQRHSAKLQDDSDEHLLVEGEKSEMSATDDDQDEENLIQDDLPSPTRHTKKARRSSLAFSVVTPAQPSAAPVRQPSAECMVTPEEFPLYDEDLPNRESAVKAPRKGASAPRNLRRRQHSILGSSMQRKEYGPSASGRNRKIPSLFESDSEDGINPSPPKCRALRSVKRRVSSSSSSVPDDNDGDDALVGSNPGNHHGNVSSDDPDNSVIEITDSLDGVGPKRSPKQNERNKGGKRVGSPDPALSSAADSLSPPSTKKRRRLRRLETICDEEDGVRKALQFCAAESGHSPKPVNAVEVSADVKRDQAAEWYNERDIDEFSSSSKEIAGVSEKLDDEQKNRSHSRPLTEKVAPVRRDILNNFSDDLDESNNDVLNSASVTPPPRANVAAAGPSGALPIDDDGNGEEAQVVEVDNCNVEREIQLVASSSDMDEVVDLVIDDDTPPPFNLIVLCEGGESIEQMVQRLGEEAVMERVIEAQENGREILGGESLGITNRPSSKNTFDKFRNTVVADQIGREKSIKSVTEEALRGEYKFNYRGRAREEQPSTGKGKKQGMGSGRSRFRKSRKRS